MTTEAEVGRRPPGLIVVAGVILMLEGIVALLLAGMLLWVSVFPPVAAVQGRPPADQTQYGPALAFVAFAGAALWAGMHALRGRRRVRLLGIVVALSAVAVVAWAVSAGGAPGAELMLAVIGLLNGLVAVVLMAWPLSKESPAVGH